MGVTTANYTKMCVFAREGSSVVAADQVVYLSWAGLHMSQSLWRWIVFVLSWQQMRITIYVTTRVLFLFLKSNIIVTTDTPPTCPGGRQQSPHYVFGNR